MKPLSCINGILLTIFCLILPNILLCTTQVSAFTLNPTTKDQNRVKFSPAVLPTTRPRVKQSKFHMMNASSIQFIAEAYSNSLVQYPFVTRGTTGFFLCGIADIIAQIRGYGSESSSANDQDLESKQIRVPVSVPILKKINLPRLGRFAMKGFFGTIIWAVWYDYSAHLLNSNNVLAVLRTVGIIDASDTIQKVARTGMLILIEQFVTCPLVYGFWEIPVSTLLNGSSTSRILYEVKDKLGDMLIENAKVWTLANVIIYNTPLQYRSAISNIMDIIWQSVVSDFAADCGNDDGMDEELVVAMQDVNPGPVGT